MKLKSKWSQFGEWSGCDAECNGSQSRDMMCMECDSLYKRNINDHGIHR
jgi:hypothetical protein